MQLVQVTCVSFSVIAIFAVGICFADPSNECLKQVSKRTPSCEVWKEIHVCLLKSNCTPEFVREIENEFLNKSGLKCGSSNGTEEQRCDDETRGKCLRRFINMTASCGVWKKLEDCLVDAKCSTDFVKSMKRDFMTKFELTCDQPETDEGKCGETAKRNCMERSLKDKPTCGALKELRSCLSNAGCSNDLVKNMEVDFQTKFGVSCDDFVGSNECGEEVRQKCWKHAFESSSPTCKVWKQLENCLLEAKCSLVFVKMMEEDFQSKFGLRCNSLNGQEEKCDQNMKDKCLKHAFRKATASCSAWNQLKDCLLEANCSFEFVKKMEIDFLSKFGLNCAKTVPALNNSSEDGCDEEFKGRCLKHAAEQTEASCGVWDELKSCLLRAKCSSEFVGIMENDFFGKFGLSCVSSSHVPDGSWEENQCDRYRKEVCLNKALTTKIPSCETWKRLKICLLDAKCSSKSIDEMEKDFMKKFGLSCRVPVAHTNATRKSKECDESSKQECLKHALVTGAATCSGWERVRNCLLTEKCSRELVNEMEKDFSAKFGLNCSVPTTDLKTVHCDANAKENCFKKVMKLPPSCGAWKQLETCLVDVKCSPELVEEIGNEFASQFKLNCDSKAGAGRCDENVKETCLLHSFKEREPSCLAWNELKNCLTKAHCSPEFIQGIGNDFADEFGLVCDSSHADAMDCDEVEIRKCWDIVVKSKPSCSAFEELKRCLLQANCSTHYVDKMEADFEMKFGLSCRGNSREERCGDDATRKCLEVVLNGKKPGCGDLDQVGKCLLDAECSPEFISTVEEDLQRDFGLECGKLEGGLCDVERQRECWESLEKAYKTETLGVWETLGKCYSDAKCSSDFVKEVEVDFLLLRILTDLRRLTSVRPRLMNLNF